MRILIKFPTRGRKDKFLSTLDKYITLCDDLNLVDILVTLDSDDIEMNTEETIHVLDELKVRYKFGISKSKIDAVNRDLNKYEKHWDILLLASDDMIPIQIGYDTIIRNKMIEYYPDTDGVLWFNDGHQGSKLNTLSILGKKYYDRFNYIYNPNYKSVWCDNEFTDVANMLGKQTYFNNILIKHEHPDAGYGHRDYIHLLNEKNNSADRFVYFSRKENNFGL